MRNGNPQLGALLVARPAEAHARILAAMRGRTIGEAADALHIARRTLTRWLEKDPKLAAACRTARQAP
jgi:ActR/RegA family two-component response regulator